jgi:transaldolase
MHSVHELTALGQSVWLDYLDHAILASGELEHWIRVDGLRGLTSNPTIFDKAIASSTDYDDFLAAAGDAPDSEVFERLCVRDVTRACDAFRHVWEETDGGDGFVSVEVAPNLAYDTLASIEAARRLWSEIARPNLMVKIPATREGLLAIERCLADGLNVNVTLLFSVQRYEHVAQAYLRALEARKSAGMPIGRVGSVASFFVSRVDTKIDAALDRAGADFERGQAAIRNARLAYEAYRRIFSGSRWRRLADAGARPQRVLWASTSTKNPAYGDLHYVEALVGPGTVDTMPKETLRSFIERGRPEVRIAADLDHARRLVSDLARAGIDYAGVMQELEDEGVRKFTASYDQAVARIGAKRRALAREPDFAPEAGPKRTEFGDRASALAATRRELKQIP